MSPASSQIVGQPQPNGTRVRRSARSFKPRSPTVPQSMPSSARTFSGSATRCIRRRSSRSNGWSGPPGCKCTPHEHRTWAVVGIYTGTEVNWLYHRTAPGLAKQSTLTLDAGNVLVLDDTAIHAVANPGPHRTVG